MEDHASFSVEPCVPLRYLHNLARLVDGAARPSATHLLTAMYYVATAQNIVFGLVTRSNTHCGARLPPHIVPSRLSIDPLRKGKYPTHPPP
jgi:hypothetical protein